MAQCVGSIDFLSHSSLCRGCNVAWLSMDHLLEVPICISLNISSPGGLSFSGSASTSVFSAVEEELSASNRQQSMMDSCCRWRSFHTCRPRFLHFFKPLKSQLTHTSLHHYCSHESGNRGTHERKRWSKGSHLWPLQVLSRSSQMCSINRSEERCGCHPDEASRVASLKAFYTSE